MGWLTVHGFDILVNDIPAMTEFKSFSDLVANFDDLTLCECLAMLTSVS